MDRSILWLAVPLLGAVAWLLWRRAERRSLPALIEKLSGRAVLELSLRGRLLGMGPCARELLGVVGRVDPLTLETLPLEGLVEHVRGSGSAGRPSAVAARRLLLHGPGHAPRPVEASPPSRWGGRAWVALEPAPALSKAPPEEASPRGSLAGTRILLADDGADNQLLLGYFLQGEGAELVLVEDGADAVSRARAESFDVVLLDMQMPGMDGYEAARHLQKLDPGLPVVALTARDQPGDEELCRAAGCTHYLAKPVRRKALLELVRGIVGARPPLLPSSVGDRELWADPAYQAMIAEFVGALGDRLLEMQRALESGDWDRLETLAHRLKGAAGGFGLPAISEASSRVESEANRHADANTAHRALVELRRAVRAAVALPAARHVPS